MIPIFAIDIETSGPNMIKNEIISIGYCLGNDQGNVIQKGKINFSFDENRFDLVTYQEFWSKHLDKLKILKLNSLSANDAINQFYKLICDLDKQYNYLRIISDNPSFDIGWINYYINLYVDDSTSLSYINGKYRSIYDTDSYSRGVLHMGYVNPWTSDVDVIKKYKLTIKANHDHLPDNDAQYIYQFHVSLINKLKNETN